MDNYLTPNWPAPPSIRAYTTYRTGGFSQAPYNSFNLGGTGGDDPQAVLANRRKLCQDLALPQEPNWLQQQHTTRVINLNQPEPISPIADASFTTNPGTICAVLTADCVPILIGHPHKPLVSAIHAGWKGLFKGIIAATIQALPAPPSEFLAWLGPAIGPQAFEVSSDFCEDFIRNFPVSHTAFTNHHGRWWADIYQLARLYLQDAGVTKIYGGEYCTFSQPTLFYSYRRDGEKSGRMASLIWIENI